MASKTLGRAAAPVGDLCSRHRGLDSLLARVGNGDRDALALLYDEVAGPVYEMSLNSGHGPAVSAEVTFDVLVRAWQQAGSYDAGAQSAWSWVRALVRSSIDSPDRAIE